MATATTSAAVAPLMADPSDAEHHVHEMAEEAQAGTAVGPSYFSQSDYDTISKLADLIIPRTDTPGAVDAGVPHWIDRQVGANAELQEHVKEGLAYLAEQAATMNGSTFSALAEEQQAAILRALSIDSDNAKSGFFKTIKDLTVENYYKTEAGLVQELGFKGNTFRSSFPGCTHPEHWPAAPTAASLGRGR